MCCAFYLAFQFGIEKKSWWDRNVGTLAGGVAGLGVFLIVGTVGFVSGPIFGAVGIVSMIVAGAIGGARASALIRSMLDVVENPTHYHFDYLIIVTVMLIGLVVALFAARYAVKTVRRAQVALLARRAAAGKA